LGGYNFVHALSFHLKKFFKKNEKSISFTEIISVPPKKRCKNQQELKIDEQLRMKLPQSKIYIAQRFLVYVKRKGNAQWH